jgi:DNA-binding MarR family transcriptional regulator
MWLLAVLVWCLRLGGEGALEGVPFGYVARVLLALLDLEREGGVASLADLARRAGLEESILLGEVKDRLVEAGLVEEETLTTYRIRALRLTARGRRLARCLEPCRELLGVA